MWFNSGWDSVESGGGAGRVGRDRSTVASFRVLHLPGPPEPIRARQHRLDQPYDVINTALSATL